MCFFPLVILVFSVARISELSRLSFFVRGCFASCFYSYVHILLFATLLFIEHASFLFFIQLVGRAAIEHFSLYLLLFISLVLFLRYCSLRSTIFLCPVLVWCLSRLHSRVS